MDNVVKVLKNCLNEHHEMIPIVFVASQHLSLKVISHLKAAVILRC
jgi:hypothetical protein